MGLSGNNEVSFERFSVFQDKTLHPLHRALMFKLVSMGTDIMKEIGTPYPSQYSFCFVGGRKL